MYISSNLGQLFMHVCVACTDNYDLISATGGKDSASFVTLLKKSKEKFPEISKPEGRKDYDEKDAGALLKRISQEKYVTFWDHTTGYTCDIYLYGMGEDDLYMIGMHNHRAKVLLQHHNNFSPIKVYDRDTIEFIEILKEKGTYHCGFGNAVCVPYHAEYIIDPKGMGLEKVWDVLEILNTFKGDPHPITSMGYRKKEKRYVPGQTAHIRNNFELWDSHGVQYCLDGKIVSLDFNEVLDIPSSACVGPTYRVARRTTREAKLQKVLGKPLTCDKDYTSFEEPKVITKFTAEVAPPPKKEKQSFNDRMGEKAKQNEAIAKDKGNIHPYKDTSGYVYAMYNPAMPGLFKVGRTAKDPKIRAKGMTSTSHVFHFDVYLSIEVPNQFEAEEKLHHALRNHRVSARREFFNPTITVLEKEFDAIAQYYNTLTNTNGSVEWEDFLLNTTADDTWNLSSLETNVLGFTTWLKEDYKHTSKEIKVSTSAQLVSVRMGTVGVREEDHWVPIPFGTKDDMVNLYLRNKDLLFDMRVTYTNTGKGIVTNGSF